MRYLNDIRDKVIEHLQTECDNIERRVVAGQAGDYAEYRGLVGQVKGLRKAVEEVNACFNKLLDEGDD